MKRARGNDFLNKLVAIEGDILLDNLGISASDREMLGNNVNIIYHSAATIRFNEPLKDAVQMNVIGTRRVIDLAKQCRKLDVFLKLFI